MPRRTLQRLVRLSPDIARFAWWALPGRARARLSPFVHPIASGPRQGGATLAVPRPARPARFDVVLAPDARLPGEEHARLVERGHRVFTPGASEMGRLALRDRVLDAVLLVGEDDRAGERVAKQMGWRVAHETTDLEQSFPEVTIVIATHAARELCRSCIHGVLRATGWGRYRIVVVDDGSRDGTEEMLCLLSATEPLITVVRFDQRRGFAAACNAGLARAQGQYVVLLNDDTVVAPGWLSRLVAHLESDARLAMICPVTNQIGNEARIDVRYDTIEAMEELAVGRAMDHAHERFDVPTVALFCAVARREALEAAGGLDERFEVGMFEDDDLSMTLRERGHGLAVARDAFVHHVGQGTFGKLTDREYLGIWQANKRRFEDKWGVAWRPPGR